MIRSDCEGWPGSLSVAFDSYNNSSSRSNVVVVCVQGQRYYLLRSMKKKAKRELWVRPIEWLKLKLHSETFLPELFLFSIFEASGRGNNSPFFCCSCIYLLWHWLSHKQKNRRSRESNGLRMDCWPQQTHFSIKETNKLHHRELCSALLSANCYKIRGILPEWDRSNCKCVVSTRNVAGCMLPPPYCCRCNY